jgi:hypothetical protein
LKGFDAAIISIFDQAGPLWQPHAAMSDWNQKEWPPCAYCLAAFHAAESVAALHAAEAPVPVIKLPHRALFGKAAFRF